MTRIRHQTRTSTPKNGGKTMLKKVAYVALLVSDQDKALDFYTNVVGLEKRGDYPTPNGPRFLTVGVEGQDFDLVLWPGTPARGDLGSAVYTIEVEDIQTAFETLKSRGVKFDPPEVLEFPWGSAARFQDPDGNLLQVREGRGEFRL
jgi:predicted enzyme related to lactoylglutathione lyase